MFSPDRFETGNSLRVIAGGRKRWMAGDDCNGCGTQSANNLINTPSTSPAIVPLLGLLAYNGSGGGDDVAAASESGDSGGESCASADGSGDR